MDTAAPEAPDIAALGTSPALETSVPTEVDPFKEAVRSATKELPTPDAVEQQGVEAGQPPEKIATALQKLRADANEAYQNVAEDHPDQAFARRAASDQDFNNRIAAQRQQATAQWAQSTFPDEGSFQQFSQAYDRSPTEAAEQNPEAAAGLDKVLSHPAFAEHSAGPAMDLSGPDGTKYGWMQAHPDMHGGYDVHVNLANGKGSGSFKLKGKATKQDAYKAFTESKIGKKAGEFHPVKAALASAAHGVEDIGAAILDKIPGLHGTATELRQYSRQKYEGNAKTTAPGMVGDLTRLGEETAGKLPIWQLGGGAGLPIEMYAEAEARGKNIADDLDANGKHEEAEQFRKYAGAYGAVSALTALVAGKLLSQSVKLLPPTTQKIISEKVGTLLGTIAAETANITAITAAQGQLVDPLFGYERAPLSNLINPGNILFGAVFGGKRYYRGAKARAESEKVKSTIKEVRDGTITDARGIIERIHGKAEDTKPTDLAGLQPIQSSTPSTEGPPEVNSSHLKRALAVLAKSPIGRLLSKGTVIVKDWQSVLAHKAMRSFSPQEMDRIKQSEGFYDPQTGKVVVILDNIRLKPGETPERAIQRVMIHERVGHEGSRWMLDNDPVFRKAWHEAAALIPQSELDEIAKNYGHLEGNSDQLIGEWFARKVEGLKPGELPDPQSALGKLWQAFKDFLARVFGRSADLDQRVRDLARDILKRPEAFEGRSGLEGDIESSVHAPGGSIALPPRQFQQSEKTKEKGFFGKFNPVAVRSRHADVESYRQIQTAHQGSVAAGNMAFDGLQSKREEEAHKLDKAKFGKDSLLGAAGAFYVEAGGDDQRLRDERDWLAKNGGAQYVPAYDKALSLTAPEKALIAKSKNDFTQNHAMMVAGGIDVEAFENYVTHVWNLENNKGRPGYGEFMSRFDPDPSSFQKRTHATLFDGLKAGLTPETLDIFKLVSINGKEVNRALATRKYAQQAVELRNSRGEPMAVINSDQASHLNDNAVDRLQQLAASGAAIPVQMRSYIKYHQYSVGPNHYAVGGGGFAHFDPSGYLPAEGRGIKGYYFQLPPPQENIDAAQAAGGRADTKNYFGQLLFHPDIQKYVNAYTGTSAVRRYVSKGTAGGAAVQGILFLNRELKSSLLGALSAFHYVQEGFHGLGHGTDPLSPLFQKIDPLDPETLKWMQSGLMLGGEHDAIEYFNGAYQREAVSPLGALSKENRARYGGLSGRGNQLIHQVPLLGWLSNMMGQHLFTQYIPSLKLATAKNVYQRNLKRFNRQLANGSMGDAEVRHITSTAVNDAYGHINWADLGIGKSARDLMQMFALAPDFLLARMRFTAQAAHLPRLLGVDRGRAGREAFLAFSVLAAGQWILARLTNWIINDGDMRTDSKDLFRVVNKKAGWSVMLRSVPGDAVEAFTNTWQFFQNRVSPLMRDAVNIAFGKNWRDEKVGHLNAAMDAAVGAMPMTAQPFLRNLTTTGQQSETSKFDDFMRTVGAKVGAYSAYYEAKSKAFDYMKSHGGDAGNDHYSPSIYKPMMVHLLNGDEAGVKEEIDKLTKGDRRQLERVVKGFHASLFRHFTGDAAHDINFRRELEKTDEGKQLLRDADHQRIDAWKLFTKVGQVSGELRAKYKPQMATPTQATLDKARDLRLQESSKL